MNYNEYPNLTKLNINELYSLYQSTNSPSIKASIVSAMTVIQESNYQYGEKIKKQLGDMEKAKTLKEQIEALEKLSKLKQ